MRLRKFKIVLDLDVKPILEYKYTAFVDHTKRFGAISGRKTTRRTHVRTTEAKTFSFFKVNSPLKETDAAQTLN
jgi:hypothetical protein